MSLSADRRARLAELRREIAEITAETPEQRQARRAQAKARRAALKASTAPNKRQPRERDPGFLAYLRRQPCCVGQIMGDACEGRTDPAHLRFADRSVGRVNPGLGAKSDDRWCLPVCRKHHDAQHAYGNEARWWSTEVGTDPNALAQKFFAAYRSAAK